MVSLNIPETLVRVAVFNGDLEKAVKKFNQECEPLSSVLGNTKQYALYKEIPQHYLFMISQQIDKKLSKLEGIEYNIQLTISSNDSQFSQQVANDFSEKSEINFYKAPEKLVELLQNITLSFLVFEKHGGKAMDVLRGF